MSTVSLTLGLEWDLGETSTDSRLCGNGIASAFRTGRLRIGTAGDTMTAWPEAVVPFWPARLLIRCLQKNRTNDDKLYGTIRDARKPYC